MRLSIYHLISVLAGVGNIETLDGFDIYDIPNVVVPSPPNNGDLSLGDGVSAFMNGRYIHVAN